MKKSLVYLLLLLIHSGMLFSQLPDNFPGLNKDDLPDASFISTRNFPGSSLYGYINGGADLYLEYGFTTALVTEIEYHGGNYKTTIYQMNDHEAAYGIFSVSRYKCIAEPPLPDYTCQTRYHLQISRGKYYISIINGRGSEEDMKTSLEIGKLITDKIEEPAFDASEFISDISKDELSKNGFLSRGRLGIVNGLPDLEDYFKGIKGYTAVMIQREEKILISAEFNDEGIYSQFIDLHGWDMEKINEAGFKTEAGEVVREYGKNHLLITLNY